MKMVKLLRLVGSGYQMEVESNNTSKTANELGSGRIGSLSKSDIVDWYKFTASSSGPVTIELSGALIISPI